MNKYINNQYSQDLIINCLFSLVHIFTLLFVDKTNCDVSYPVCGVNGETYSHECAALADEVLVDYVGPCRSISQLRGKTNKLS